jgi:phosphatidylglycerol lysyltransferase
MTRVAAAAAPHLFTDRRRLAEMLAAGAGLVVFLAALEVLRVELRTVSLSELLADIRSLPRGGVALAVALTALNYVVLAAYDLVGFAYIGHPLRRSYVMLTSFLAYAVANNISFAMLTGATVRYRFYSRKGVTTEQLSRIVFSYTVTFWLGLFALGGLSLILTPAPTDQWVTRTAAQAAGWVLLLLPPAYLAATRAHRGPLRLWKLTFPLPPSRLASMQLVLSILDWSLVGAVLYALLPSSELTFLRFMGLFLVAILIGMASHVPGGVGVFEGLMVLFLRPALDARAVLPALVVFRAVYYLLPLSIAVVVLLVDDLQQRRTMLTRVGSRLAWVSRQLTPRVLAVFTFAAGLLLLFSGATPAESNRLAFLARVLPLGVIEISHFTASVAGAVLLVLSQGLARRLDAAYYVTVIMLAVGIVTSLVKGIDFEEAALLSVVLGALYNARSTFDRRAAFFETRFSPAWIATVAAAMCASLWLGMFAFEHVEYSRDLWWQFELQADASRFLRGSVGAGVVLLLVAAARLIGHAPYEAAPPSDTDLRDAAAIVAAQPSTSPNLVFLRDKALLFDDERTAFIMYSVQGRTWVALGDPVGPAERVPLLIKAFLERCHDFGGVAAFYEVTPAHLYRYADFGLTFAKLGEEARVDLGAFTLEGGHAAKLRQAIRRLDRDRATFRIVEPADVPHLMSELREVSDDWLELKASAEKGFSLGYFNERYLSRFPIAIIERNDRIEAFANVWRGASGVELSIDLMRHRRDAPNGVMEALFVHLMSWGKAHGYRWFALGMAPLSGFEETQVASLWTRIGGFLYQHGESFYNFQGLRAYKQKFNPVWEPRYLAWAGALRLPRVLADISVLIAGGYQHIFRR